MPASESRTELGRNGGVITREAASSSLLLLLLLPKWCISLQYLRNGGVISQLIKRATQANGQALLALLPPRHARAMFKATAGASKEGLVRGSARGAARSRSRRRGEKGHAIRHTPRATPQRPNEAASGMPRGPGGARQPTSADLRRSPPTSTDLRRSPPISTDLRRPPTISTELRRSAPICAAVGGVRGSAA